MQRRCLWFFMLLSVAGCVCDPFSNRGERFHCDEDSDCAKGYRCVEQVCSFAGGTGGGTSSVGGGGGSGGGGLDGAGGGGAQGGGAGGGVSEVDGGLPVLRFSNLPYTDGGAYAGRCVPLTLERIMPDGGAADLSVPVDVTLSAQPETLSSVQFFAAADCTGPALTTTTIDSNEKSVTLYASGWTGASYVLDVVGDGFVSESQDFQVRPVVRNGRCRLLAGEAQKTCGLSLPIVAADKAALIYQTVTSTALMSRGAVLCDFMGTTAIRCTRQDGTTDPADVFWQVLELDGLSVQRVTATCPSDGGTQAVVPMTRPATFVLAAQQTDSVDLDGTTLAAVERKSSSVQVNWGVRCDTTINSSVALQLVSVPGAQAQVLIYSLDAGSLAHTLSLQPPSGTTGNGVVLATHTVKESGPGALCSRAFRTFNRTFDLTSQRAYDGGVATCTDAEVPRLVAERFWLGSSGRITELTPFLPTGSLSGAVNFSTAVDTTRTLVLASGQIPGLGQGVGETHWDAGSPVGVVVAAHVLDAGVDLSSRQLWLIRGSARGSSRWTSFLITFGP